MQIDDVVKELRERMRLRYMADCKCGKCQLVRADQLERAADALESHRARVAVLEEALTSLSNDAIAEAKDALDTIQATLRHRQQPQDATLHRGLKALRDAEWKIRAALTSKES